MKTKLTGVLFIIGVAVNLSNAYTIKSLDGAVSGSFSGSHSSSSSSAFSQSSSSSFGGSFNRPLGSGDVEHLKEVLKSGIAVGAGAVSGATAGAVSGAVAGAQAGSLAEVGSNVGHLPGTGSGAASGSISGCSGSGGGCSGIDSNNVDDGGKIIKNGIYMTTYSDKYNKGSGSYTSGCPSCKGPFPGSNGNINDYKLTSDVPAAPAVSGSKDSAPQNAGGAAHFVSGAGAGASTIGSLPGPSDSIYTSKPATGPSYQIPEHPSSAVPSGSSGTSYSGTDSGLITSLPGTSGSIYDSKPAFSKPGGISYSGAGVSSGGNDKPSSFRPACSYTPGLPNQNCGGPITVPGNSVNHSASKGSTGTIPILPGPSGSIYDNKPASSVPTHGQSSFSGAGATSGVFSDAGAGVTGIKLPGPSGSIYDSKPALPIPGHVGSSYSGSGAGSGASGEVSGKPSSYPNLGPACSYTPGSPIKNCGGSQNIPATGSSPGFNSGSTVYHVAPGSSSGIISSLPGPSGSIYDSKPASSVPTHSGNVYSGTGVTSGAGATTGVSGIPASHPIIGPVCSYTPGSPNKNNCGGSQGSPIAGSRPGSSTVPGSSIGIIASLPGSLGSIYDSKPASSVTPHGGNSYLGSGAGSGAFGNAVASSGVTGIPSSHPVVGPVCSYTPGSPNYCGSASQSSKPGAGGAVNSHKGEDAGTSGCLTCKGPFPGPSGSIYDSKPASSVAIGGSGAGAHSGSSTSTSGNHVAPSVPAQVSPGTYYVNKPSALPAKDIRVPLIHSPSFSGQIPCSDNSCGSETSSPNYYDNTPSSGPHCLGGNCGSQTPVVPSLPSKPNCAPGSICNNGPLSGSTSGAYSGSASGSTSGSVSGSAVHGGDFVYVDKDTSGQYTVPSHDDSHLSGGISFQNEDGSYHHDDSKTDTKKPINYKNSDGGGYAVSDADAGSSGLLIGPGTGHLPIEKDHKPFGTQGAFGGSAAFVKNAEKEHKPFGTQGAFGGSDAFANGGSSSGSKSDDYSPSCQNGASCSPSDSGFATGQVTIQKVDGALVSPIDIDSYTTERKPAHNPGCSGSSCSGSGFGSDSEFGGGSSTGNGFATGQVTIQKGHGFIVSPQDKPGCAGDSCLGSGISYIAGQTTGNHGPYNREPLSGNTPGCSSGSCSSGLGSGSGNGFATGQVIINKRPDAGYSGLGCSTGSCLGGSFGTGNGISGGQVVIPKSEEHIYGNTKSGYSDSLSGSHSGIKGGYSGGSSSGCVTGLCGNPGFGSGSYSTAGSFASASGGILNKLFRPDGLSGSLTKAVAGGGGSAIYPGSAAYSNAGSFGGLHSVAGAGSYASASAHAGAFASSY